MTGSLAAFDPDLDLYVRLPHSGVAMVVTFKLSDEQAR